MLKYDMPLARLRPLAYAAYFAPSGWKAATPRPPASTSTSTSGYHGDTAASPTPTAASTVPPGISQSAPRRSDQSPNNGWTSDDDTVEASKSIAASAYPRWKRSV